MAQAAHSGFIFDFQSPSTSTPSNNDNHQTLSDVRSSPDSSSSIVASVNFDDLLDARRLNLSPAQDFDRSVALNTPGMFNFPADTFGSHAGFSPDLSGVDSQTVSPPAQKPSTATPQRTMSDVAIDLTAMNFILA